MKKIKKVVLVKKEDRKASGAMQCYEEEVSLQSFS